MVFIDLEKIMTKFLEMSYRMHWRKKEFRFFIYRLLRTLIIKQEHVLGFEEILKLLQFQLDYIKDLR